MSLQSVIKRIIRLTREKQIVSVQHYSDPNKILSGKTAVVLGGSGGIGFAIAKSLCESGCRVIICGTNEEKLRLNVDKIGAPDMVSYIVFNISEIDAIPQFINQIFEQYGNIDILVDSAGVHTSKVDFFNMTPKEYDRVMDTNIKAAYFICQKFAECMIKKNIHGHILLISSSRGMEPAWSPYGLSKWAMNGMVKGFAKILLPYGIVVNGIAPGSTATELIGVKEGDNLYTEENKMNRLIMPDEVANLAKLLVSNAGDMIVGEVISISAGRGTCDIR